MEEIPCGAQDVEENEPHVQLANLTRLSMRKLNKIFADTQHTPQPGARNALAENDGTISAIQHIAPSPCPMAI